MRKKSSIIYFINRGKDYVNYMKNHSFTTLTENSRFSWIIELNNILHYWCQKRSSDFSSSTRLYLIYGIHYSLQRLLGCLILFVTYAFVPQRQFLHRRLPSPLPVLRVSQNIDSPLKSTVLLVSNSSQILLM
ncbi:hypothetical protein VUR80DRAFT_9947 [Thermomyces stellatus]